MDTKYHPDSGRKEDKTRLVAHFLNLVYLDDASSQGYMHIDKSMNEEVHALACCILSQCLACPALRVAKAACGDGKLHACHEVPARCSDGVRLAV